MLTVSIVLRFNPNSQILSSLLQKKSYWMMKWMKRMQHYLGMERRHACSNVELEAVRTIDVVGQTRVIATVMPTKEREVQVDEWHGICRYLLYLN